MYTATAPKVIAAKRQSNLVVSTAATSANSRITGKMENQVRKQRGDAARAALDVARHATGLALEVEAQRQAVQVPEDAERDAPHGAL